ncbi:diguanylate cyclase [Altericista sp. CCNU0014]|uniref:diguanylate cyclase n=1 Tax=Altericista sp. CCNU0014 TaxID=3082949 RepID=UPI00384EA287
MTIPLLAIAIGSYLSFERAIETFENSESRRLEELFPLDRLEDSLMKASRLLKDTNDSRNGQSKDNFEILSREIEQTFTQLLRTPSQLAERRSLILGIQREWQETKGKRKQFATDLTPANRASQQRLRSQIDQHLEIAIDDIRRLNKLLTNFQMIDNQNRATEIKQQVRTATILTGTVTVLMGMGSAYFLARSILKPLKRLNVGVAQFGEGELSHRIHLETGDELEQLATTINWMAENLEKNQQALTELATMDVLTGVFNRREFNRRLTIEIERSRREGHSVSLLMVDIDYFKKINDTYGHQSGDDALRHVSALIKAEVRPGDLPARYGGEEFAVILPYADSNDAFVVAERLRNLIAAQDIAIQDGQTIKATASLGCSTFPADAETEEALMTEADAALYRAKRGGRNRVCIAQQDISVTTDMAVGRSLPSLDRSGTQKSGLPNN